MQARLQVSRGSANPGTSSSRLSPDGKVHHVIDLVSPNKAAEGEALELDNEDVGQPPQHQLLGSLAVLLALGAVPGGRVCSLLAWREPQSLHPSSASGSPHAGLAQGTWRAQPFLAFRPVQSSRALALLPAGLALPSAQGRPGHCSWLPGETACRSRQLLGNPCCCLGPLDGTHPAAFLTTLPLGPGLQAS